MVRISLSEFRSKRDATREEMGGASKIQALVDAGKLTARQWIELLCDEGSFVELGTFAASEHPDMRASTPGDGVIMGFGTRRGQRLVVIADDVTVKKASSSVVNQVKINRAVELASKSGCPLVYFAGRGGARIPDSLGSEGFFRVGGDGGGLALRQRSYPMVTVVVDDSYGGSSLYTMYSDLVVQLAGTSMAMTSPRVIEVATGEQVDPEALGGAQLHYSTTGLVDLVATSPEGAVRVVHEFLDLLRQASEGSVSEFAAANDTTDADRFSPIVPTERRKTYDMRDLLMVLCDDGRFLELRGGTGPGLMVGIARIQGQVAGVMASQPLRMGGALTPQSCDKAVRLLCLCDAFKIPVISLVDTPGFLVGTQVEHEGLVPKAVMFQQALTLARVPLITVLIRKAFGLALFSLGGSTKRADLFYSWPTAEIGFMDPVVGSSVLWADEVAHLDPAERREELSRLAESLATATDPFGPAAVMKIDEIIDPADTRRVLGRSLVQLAPMLEALRRSKEPGPLNFWPTVW